MLAYVLRRLLVAAPVLVGILLISFILVQLMPGDPVRALMSPEEMAASPEYVARRRAELGLDDPVLVQFLAWVRELAQGHLGYSFHGRVPVAELIGERIGPTVLLALVALAIALIVGISIGVVAALRQNSWFDYLASIGSMAAVSIPAFFLGLMAIYIFSIQLGILPTGGLRSLTSDGSLGDSIRHLVLPAGVLAASLVGPYVRYTRQGMLEVLRQDFMTTARAKGVPRFGVVVGHGLRNTLIPLTTVIALQLPGLLTGVLIIEVIFSWPGLGQLVYDSIIGRDYPVIIATVFFSAVLVMVANLLADLLAAVLDPRIRL
ncbi:ABC transporter permease [Jiangella alkaliphila]|uniref:Peptide/nickel transport system permease protein n=1 Tax=Jiangella alkaliphila TaxID=419479 RepID=A0A1H2K379_9ACTN|nr:ABC transporter permease [Jiangella alkaliphila]SDU63167.1 peptide/nickel transport system permease protein [Jiangella alkaliphila]